jgi:hypothetical protein
MAEVIKEFGVKLGFNVDENDSKGVEHSMTLAIAKGELFGNVLSNLVIKAGEYVSAAVKMADEVYWLTKRVGMTAEDFEAISFYAKNLGASAESAKSSIKGLSDTIKEQVGLKQAIESYAHTVIKDTNISGKNFEDIANFFKKLKTEGKEPMARGFARQWGIDKDMLEAMLADHQGFLDQYKKKVEDAGLEGKDLQENSHKLIELLTSLQVSVKLIFERVASEIVNDKDKGLQKFIDYVDEHSKEISDAMLSITLGLISFGTKLVEYIPKIDAWITKTIGWKWAFALLTLALIALRLSMGRFLKSLLWWLVKYGFRFALGSTIAGIAGPIATFGAAMSGGSAPETEEFKKYDEKQMEKSAKGYGTLGNLAVNLWKGNGFTTANPNETSSSATPAAPSAPQGKVPDSIAPTTPPTAPQPPAATSWGSRIKSWLTSPVIGSSNAATDPAATPPPIRSLPVPPLPPPVPAKPPVNTDGAHVTVEGNQPTALDHINALGPEELRGKTITISPGTSGGPHTMQQVREQIDAAIAKGANPASIRIIGAGGSPAMNSSLESFAKEKGFMYLAPGSMGKKGIGDGPFDNIKNYKNNTPAIGSQSRNEVRVKTVNHIPVTNTYNVYGDSDNVGGVVASNIEANSKRLKKALA